MARLVIPDEPTAVTFDVTTSESAFPFDFAIFSKDDLRVQVGRRVLEQNEFTLAGTLLETGGYQGGVVNLTEPVSDVTLVVFRKITPERAEGFGPVNTVPVPRVDQAFNRQMAVSQDLDQLKVNLPMESRAETLLAFDGNGNSIALPVVQVLNEIGLTFEDDGAWGAQSDPLTYDDGAFA